jgi:hypothetical protein
VVTAGCDPARHDHGVEQQRAQPILDYWQSTPRTASHRRAYMNRSKRVAVTEAHVDFLQLQLGPRNLRLEQQLDALKRLDVKDGPVRLELFDGGAGSQSNPTGFIRLETTRRFGR